MRRPGFDHFCTIEGGSASPPSRINFREGTSEGRMPSKVGTVSITVTPASFRIEGSFSASPIICGVATNRVAPTR